MIDWELILAKARYGLIAEGPGCALGAAVLALFLLPEQSTSLLNIAACAAAGALAAAFTEGWREYLRQRWGYP